MTKQPGLTDEFHLALLAEIGLGRAALMHEMRQPMAAIKLTLRLAFDRADDPELSGYLRDAITQVDRLATLLDQNQRFMQPSHSAIEEFSVQPVVKRVLRLLEHSLRRRGIEVVVELDDLALVKASITSVEQILFNLVNNARDAVVEQGEQGRLLLRSAALDESVELIVANDGAGIPESFRSTIFKPYATTKGGKGTGMGLYVARKLAAAFGGELTLLDHTATEALCKPPFATALKLRIPRAPAEAEEAPLKREPSVVLWSANAVLEGSLSRSPRICAQIADLNVQRAVNETCASIEVDVDALQVPCRLSYTDVDLILVELTEASAQVTLETLGGHVGAPPIIALLREWTGPLARRCIELGCQDALKAPAGSSVVPELQAAILAALEEQRALRAALMLVRGAAPEGAPLNGNGAEQLAQLLSNEAEHQPEVAIWGSPPLIAMARLIFNQVHLPPPGEPLPPVADLLLVEPSEEQALSQQLDVVRNDELASVVVCAERLSTRELQHLIDRGIYHTLNAIHSEPELAKLRLTALTRRLQARNRLASALKMLMREPMELMKPAALARRRRVMIVEDEPVMLRVLTSVLRPHGYQLFACSSGEQALEILAEDEVDLIISDKNLPGITGLEVIRQAKERRPEIATLMITGYASQETVEEAIQLGVDDYLVKPFDLDDLMGKVKELIARPGPEAAETKAERPRGVVLAVRDPGTQELIERVFDKLGEPVVGKGPATPALNLLGDREVGIVVIDLDQSIDKAHQEQLQQAWSARAPLIVIALATRPDLTRTLEALRLGARALLRKPLTDLALVDKLIRETCNTKVPQ
jgi:DNA-binding response OmpR family regulator/two-component sensor histidine kinase